MKSKFFISFFLPILCATSLIGQSLKVNGSVYGFYGDKVLLLKKASKNLAFEGPISNVIIHVEGSSTESTIKTDISGNYEFVLPAPGKYLVVVNKSGSSTLKLNINYVEQGEKSAISLLSFIVKAEDNTTSDLGELTIGQNGVVSHSSIDFKQKSGNSDVLHSNSLLLDKTVTLNNSSKRNIIASALPTKEIVHVSGVISSPSIITVSDKGDSTNLSNIKRNLSVLHKLSLNLNDSSLSAEDLKSLLDSSKAYLSSLDPTDEYYQILQNQVKSAETQLALKEKYIKAKDAELKQADKVISFMISVIVVGVLLFGFLIYYLMEKRKFSRTLSQKNEEILKVNNKLLSSINYASVIQGNLLKSRTHFNDLFSDAFIFFKPKDILSGDFFWFHEQGGTKLVIAADCTGHGVPGALLAVMCHGLLEDIVVKKKKTSPSEIINELNTELIKAFSNQKEVEYGVELTIVSINSKLITIASSGTGAYVSKGNSLTWIEPKVSFDVTNNFNQIVKETEVDATTGDIIFLMSDGFQDQFKGGTTTATKYNKQNFEVLLSNISSNKSIKDAESVVLKELDSWRGEVSQTDDVLVIGFRI